VGDKIPNPLPNKDTKTKRATFTYHVQGKNTVTELIKNTKTWIAFGTTNTIKTHLK
jgi:hypothetical protein